MKKLHYEFFRAFTIWKRYLLIFTHVPSSLLSFLPTLRPEQILPRLFLIVNNFFIIVHFKIPCNKYVEKLYVCYEYLSH